MRFWYSAIRPHFVHCFPTSYMCGMLSSLAVLFIVRANLPSLAAWKCIDRRATLNLPLDLVDLQAPTRGRSRPRYLSDSIRSASRSCAYETTPSQHKVCRSPSTFRPIASATHRLLPTHISTRSPHIAGACFDTGVKPIARHGYLDSC